jgi:dipeptide/tripeptide permease
MLKNHPKGLAFIFFTEMWERVGFYTLMAILVLYMDKVLGWPDSRKGDFYGIFLFLCYFMPLLGGWLGDKVLGQIRTVRAGAVLMGLGYVGLAVSSPSAPASSRSTRPSSSAISTRTGRNSRTPRSTSSTWASTSGR